VRRRRPQPAQPASPPTSAATRASHRRTLDHHGGGTARPTAKLIKVGFDLEHTARLFKQVLGWSVPKIRDPAAAGRWTWLIITCHTQLRLAQPPAADLRRPWERAPPPGLRNIRAKAAQPAGAPKSGKPGPGQPPGLRIRHQAPHYGVGKRRRGNLRSWHGTNAQFKRQSLRGEPRNRSRACALP
jgi:hypothetical protein